MGHTKRDPLHLTIPCEPTTPHLAAGDHHAVTEAQMQHGLAVVDERVEHSARVHVPHAHRAVRRARDNGALVVL